MYPGYVPPGGEPTQRERGMSDEENDESALTLPSSGRVPRKKTVPLEQVVDDALLIARTAVTLDVKNQIIVGALREGRPFNVDTVRAAVIRELLLVARENEASAQRVQQLAVDVRTPRGAVDNSEGYQVDDHPTLTKRGIIHVLLADELERLSGDDDYVAELAEQARLRAWAEVGEAIENRLLDAATPPRDPSYDRDKAARIRAFYNINLRALERQARRAGRLRES
jgi:hypothetical protein